MGYFSWMFANHNNQRNLKIDRKGYLYCPNGTILKEPCYEGYGKFAGQDVYDLVADWNRAFLAQNPDFIIPQHGYFRDEATGELKTAVDKKVSEFPWYSAYADLSKSREEVIEAWQKATGQPRVCCEWRIIGIDIACYDDQNAALPYPIKICSTGRGLRYETLPPSNGDPNQGMY